MLSVWSPIHRPRVQEPDPGGGRIRRTHIYLFRRRGLRVQLQWRGPAAGIGGARKPPWVDRGDRCVVRETESLQLSINILIGINNRDCLTETFHMNAPSQNSHHTPHTHTHTHTRTINTPFLVFFQVHAAQLVGWYGSKTDDP